MISILFAPPFPFQTTKSHRICAGIFSLPMRLVVRERDRVFLSSSFRRWKTRLSQKHSVLVRDWVSGFDYFEQVPHLFFFFAKLEFASYLVADIEGDSASSQVESGRVHIRK